VSPELEPTYFETAADFRAWLAKHGESTPELLLAYYKKGTGHPSITYPESVDEALCFGWIDGVRRSLGDQAYTIRFTPRKAKSYWSAANIRRAHQLNQEGRMTPAGLAAFDQRDEEKADRYSFERATVEFTPEMEKRFRDNPDAWAWFQKQPPSYKRPATHLVTSAKQEATRLKRLDTLIEDSAAGRRIAPLRRPGIDKPLAIQKDAETT
jgi:uncharacterized protein YdeI (YjbR/CyaY-like superfamily)